MPTFIGTLLELLVMRSLLNKVQNGVGQSSVSEGKGLGVNSRL